MLIFLKAHVSAYTKKDGTFVAEHDRHTRYAEMFKPSLGIRREDMPQVPGALKQRFIDGLRAAGVSVERQTVKPGTLKPTQSTYNAANMDYLTSESRAGRLDASPILVSQDGRVMDGHHRWAVAHLEGQEQPVIRVGLPIDKLIEAARKFAAENGIENRRTDGGATIAKGGDDAIAMDHHPAPGEPTRAQAEAGNYKKRVLKWNGLAIAIENPAGSVRRGRGWQTRMLYDYGYIKRSGGVDGDEVDVYLGPALDYAPSAYVVHQRKFGRWDEYDEDKVMLGFLSIDDAATAYLKHYDDPRFLGPITEMPVEEFVTKVRATHGKPAMIKGALDFGSLVLFKSRVGPYLRGGKLVNLSGYEGRTARAQASSGRMTLFSCEPEAPARPNPYKGKDPVKDTPDLFDGKTPRERDGDSGHDPDAKHPLQQAQQKVSRLIEKHAAAREAGDDKKASFHAMNLDYARKRSNELGAAFRAFNKHGDGTELSTSDGKRHAVLLPDASNPGKYRYQMFDEQGFSAHSTHDTPEEAVADAVSQGYTEHNPGILDRLAGTEEWAHGMAVNAVMQAHNSRQIDWSTAMERIRKLGEEREAKRRPAAPPAPSDPEDDHPSKPTRSLLNLVPEDRRAEWLELHRQQHELHHYELGQSRERLERARGPMRRAESALREAESSAALARRGGDLPGTDERIRGAEAAVAKHREEFEKRRAKVDSEASMHQTLYERAAKLGRQKERIAATTGDMDIDWASMRKRTDAEQREHEKSMLRRYREHYKVAGRAITKSWDWLGTEPLRGQMPLFIVRP